MTNTTANQPVAIGFFGLMFSMPLLVPVHQFPIPSFYSEWLAILLSLPALLAMGLRKQHLTLHFPPIAIAPLGLMLVALLQLGLGMFAYPATAFTLCLYLLWSTLLALAGRTLVAGAEKFGQSGQSGQAGEKSLCTPLAWCLLGGGLINALFGLLQYFQLSQLGGALITAPMAVSSNGIYGNLAQQNHFATHMALALASATYLYLVRQLGVRGFGMISLILLAAMVLSGSRSSFLYLIWLIALTAWLLRRTKQPDTPKTAYKRLGWWVFGVYALIITGLWLASHFWSMNAQIERLGNLSGALGPRFFLWKSALLMFFGQPLLGVGFDAFAYHLIGQLHAHDTYNIWGVDQYAHNLPLQLLAVSGLAGFTAVALPLLLLLRRLNSRRLNSRRLNSRRLNVQVHATARSSPGSPASPAEPLWRFGILGILLIHSLLEQPLYFAYFLGIAAFLTGMGDPAAWVMELGTKSRAHTAGKAVAMLLFTLALILTVRTAHDYDTLEGYFYSGRYLNDHHPDPPALRRNILHDLHTHSLFAPLAELIAPADFAPENNSASAKIAFNLRVMHYAPVAEVEYRHASLLAQAGRMDQALQQFKRAAYAYPAELPQYLERFNALATSDAATYGPLAAYANALANKLQTPTQ